MAHAVGGLIKFLRMKRNKPICDDVNMIGNILNFPKGKPPPPSF